VTAKNSHAPDGIAAQDLADEQLANIVVIEGHAIYLQDAQLSQRDRAAGCVIVFANKSRRLELGDNILRTV